MTSRSRTCLLSLCALVWLGLGGALSCTSTPNCVNVTKSGNPANHCFDPAAGNPITMTLAKECGLDISCRGELAAGYTSISGVQSVDSYFDSVVRFKVEADALRLAVDRELATLRATLGVEPSADLGRELRARIAASTEGGLRFRTDAPRCEVARAVVLAASNRCEGEVNANAEVECYGRCEQPAGTDVACDGTAELACTFLTGASHCAGECKGRCTTDLPAELACAGVCRGSCTGACSLYSDQAATECAGRCDGMCAGTCEVELLAGALCAGTCSGECTAASMDGSCEGATSASCQAAPNSSVACTGRCEGEIGLPKGRVECEAVAKAEAKMSLRCSPPGVSIEYELRSDLDPDERASFEFAMRTLQQRLPALLATLARADETLNAGVELIANVASLKAAAHGALSGDASLSVKLGVACALKEADNVPEVLEPAAEGLSTSMAYATAVTSALGMQ